jgi:hypothetical protein
VSMSTCACVYSCMCACVHVGVYIEGYREENVSVCVCVYLCMCTCRCI